MAVLSRSKFLEDNEVPSGGTIEQHVEQFPEKLQPVSDTAVRVCSNDVFPLPFYFQAASEVGY